MLQFEFFGLVNNIRLAQYFSSACALDLSERAQRPPGQNLMEIPYFVLQECFKINYLTDFLGPLLVKI